MHPGKEGMGAEIAPFVGMGACRDQEIEKAG